jgi:hypothetical protein
LILDFQFLDEVIKTADKVKKAVSSSFIPDYLVRYKTILC